MKIIFDSVFCEYSNICLVKNLEGKFNLAYCENLKSKNFVFDENKAKILFADWFDKIKYMTFVDAAQNENDFALTLENGTWCLVNITGHIFYMKKLEFVSDFKVCHANASCFDYSPIKYNESDLRHKELALVSYNGFFNYMDKDGNFISKEWFNFVGSFTIEGWARVKRGNNKWNYINILGKLKDEKKWFDFCGDYLHGYAFVSLKSENYFIDSSTDCKYKLENMRTIFPDDVIFHIVGLA